MTIPVQTPVEVTTLPAGQTLTTLNFTFRYIDASTVDVSVNDVELLESAYSVTNQVITFTPPLVGVTGGSKITVYLSMQFSRTNDLIQSSPIYAADLNKQLDRLTLMLQQSEYGTSKSIIFDPSDAETLNTKLPVAALRANRALVFKADGSVDVSTDLYVNQVALCQEQVTLATTQATNSANSATASHASELLARDWANKATDVETGFPSAKTWAQTASAIAIPNGSITANKMNTTETFTFNDVTTARGQAACANDFSTGGVVNAFLLPTSKRMTWGRIIFTTGQTFQTVTFPFAFTNAASICISCTQLMSGGDTLEQTPITTENITATSFRLKIPTAPTGAATVTIMYQAVGT
jgi:hypothetical protein